MGWHSQSEGRGFESQHHILEGHFFTLICCEIVSMFVWKRQKLNEKEVEYCPFFKKIVIPSFYSIVSRGIFLHSPPPKLDEAWNGFGKPIRVLPTTMSRTLKKNFSKMWRRNEDAHGVCVWGDKSWTLTSWREQSRWIELVMIDRGRDYW